MPDLWQIISSVIGFLAILTFGVISALAKRLYDKLQGEYESGKAGVLRLENRLNTLERDGLDMHTQLLNRLMDMPREFIPRSEFAAVVEGVRSQFGETQRAIAKLDAETHQGIDKLDRKLDSLIMHHLKGDK
jgi:hypothetical protein